MKPPTVTPQVRPHQGVQQAFVRAFVERNDSDSLELFHLVPVGQACSWPGRELVAGKDIKERKARRCSREIRQGRTMGSWDGRMVGGCWPLQSVDSGHN